MDAPDDGDAGSGPRTVDDGDGNWPRIPQTDVEQRKVDGAKGPGLDSLAIEPNVAPIGVSVPFRSIFGLVLFHRLIDGHSASFWEFVGDAHLANGFLLPLAHAFPMPLPVMNAPYSTVGRTMNRVAGVTVMSDVGVQRTYAPNSICFGCGPANEHGLKIDSFRTEDGLVMEFVPSDHHQAFPGMINGGIIGTLLDCHGNWAAAIAIMDAQGLEEPPCTVTASYDVQLRRPTPLSATLTVNAKPTEVLEDRVRVALTLEAEGKVCATGSGLFVAVKEGHPAYHRWS